VGYEGVSAVLGKLKLARDNHHGISNPPRSYKLGRIPCRYAVLRIKVSLRATDKSLSALWRIVRKGARRPDQLNEIQIRKEKERREERKKKERRKRKTMTKIETREIEGCTDIGGQIC